jgi:hypothetical protein
MNKKEFLLKCIDFGATDLDFYKYKFNHKPSSDIEDFNFQVQWSLGGMSGGSCWNNGAKHSFSGESEKDLESLDELLQEICPSISMMQYKKLYREIVKRDEREEREYYGNYTNYGTKACNVLELYNWLKDMKLL